MKRVALAAVASAALFSGSPALAQAQPLLGQLMLVGFTYCPSGWAEADGRLLPISQNSALFSLYGCTYGGDCRTTFALPDLRGRVVMGVGSGPGLPPATLGQKVGVASNTLTVNQLPAHSHALRASSGDPDDQDPNNALLATFPSAGAAIYSLDAADVTMSAQAIGSAGGSQPFDEHQPSLVLRYCVALQGIFPSRN